MSCEWKGFCVKLSHNYSYKTTIVRIPALEWRWKSVSGRPRTRTRESLRSQLPLPLSRCPTTESPPSSEHTHTYKRERKKKKFIGIVATTQKQRHERKSDYERETICS
jgi:hypothetical protein